MRLINRRPDRTAALLLAMLPFVLVLIAYILGSAARLADNPADKLLPSLATIADAIARVGFNPDARTGDYLLLNDTLATLDRLLTALALSTAI